MDIVKKGLGELQPYGQNAKRHTAKQVAHVAASIERFGWVQPIVCDSEGVIVIGHCRYEAAKRLKLAEVPVVVAEGLTDAEIKALRLADNKLNESPWEKSLVVAELQLLSPELAALTGFPPIYGNEKDDDVLPELVSEPKTKPGDTYELGGHRITCGDATKAEAFDAVMGESDADMVFTDRPYGIDYAGSGKKTSNKIKNDNLKGDEFLDLLVGSFTAAFARTKRGAGWYVFHDPSTQSKFQDSLEKSGLEVRYQLIWNKPSAGLGMNEYRKKHEPFFYCGARGETPNFYGDRCNATVVKWPETEQESLEYLASINRAEKEGKTTIWTDSRENVGDYVHPTQKPVNLIVKAIQNSSKKGDIVLDFFSGSGATMIACEKTGREFRGIELDPIYVDAIVQRFVDYTGNENIKLNGKEILWPKSKSA